MDVFVKLLNLSLKQKLEPILKSGHKVVVTSQQNGFRIWLKGYKEQIQVEEKKSLDNPGKTFFFLFSEFCNKLHQKSV